MISISVINLSTVVSDADVRTAMADLQTQVTRDFAPAWGVDAKLVFVPKDGPPPSPDSWWLVLLDDSDAADALGYHDLTSTGMPLGKIFAKSDLDCGNNWTVTASHELLEMLADPWANRLVPNSPDPAHAIFYTCEVCDACEDEKFGYKIGSTLVSNFVYPQWFEAMASGQVAKLDQLGMIKAPFGLLTGGYIGILNPKTGWSQLNGPHDQSKSFAETMSSHQVRIHVGSRRDKRIRKALGFDLVRSTPGKGPNRRPGSTAAAVMKLCLELMPQVA